MSQNAPRRGYTEFASAGGHEGPIEAVAETVVDKIRLVVETLGAGGSMGLSALAREAGLSKTTVHRLCGELVDWGIVDRIDGQFTIGNRMAELGQLVPARQSLRELGHPYAVELFTAFRQSVNVSVLQGLDVRCVAKVTGVNDESTGWLGVGTRAPAHCTAAGKAILAFSPPEIFNAVVARPLPSVTPYTVCAPRKLAMQLREVRRTGFSLVRQEARIGTTSLGVPIIDRRGHVAGALTINLSERTNQWGEMVKAMKMQSARLASQLP